MSGAAISTGGSVIGQAATARSTSRRRNPAQRSSSASSTYSSGLCATVMSPGPQTTLAMPRAANRPASVPNATLAGGPPPASAVAEMLDRRMAGAAQRRIAHQLLPFDRRVGMAGAHLRQKLSLGEGLHLVQERRRVLARQDPELELEAAPGGHDVERGAAVHDARGDRAVRRIEARLEGPSVRNSRFRRRRRTMISAAISIALTPR